MISSTAALLIAARTHAAGIRTGETGAIRLAARRELGIGSGARVYTAGGQPLYFGGPLSVLGKLAVLKHMKQIDPDALTVYRFCAYDAAKSNREVYRAFFPRGGGVWVGLSRARLRSGMPTAEVALAPIKQLVDAREILGMYGPSHASSFLRLVRRSQRETLGDFNMSFLRRLALILGVEPDVWLVDGPAETSFLATGMMSWLLHRWPRIVESCNHEIMGETRPLDEQEAPFWVFYPGQPARLQGSWITSS